MPAQVGRDDLAVSALLYAVVMPATALAFVSVARRLLAAEERAAAVGETRDP